MDPDGCCFLPATWSLIRQHFASGFQGEGNNQQSDAKGNRCERNRLAKSSHVSDQRTDSEVGACGNEASERRGEGEGGGPLGSPVLLRQPQAEDGEVAAKEAQKEQHRDEGMESVRQVERPTEAQQDAGRHADEVKG